MTEQLRLFVDTICGAVVIAADGVDARRLQRRRKGLRKGRLVEFEADEMINGKLVSEWIAENGRGVFPV